MWFMSISKKRWFGITWCSSIYDNLILRTFCDSTGDTQLAVLHPRLLSVYLIQKSQNAKQPKDGKESQYNGFDNYQLSLVYQHKLSRSAHTMVAGRFGRVINKDFICVQSIDGTLSVFEQESHAFSRFLPGNTRTLDFESTDQFSLKNYKMDWYRYLGASNQMER